MRVSSFWGAIGAILTIALVATLLSHGNTAADINAVGNQFTSAVKTAKA